MSLICPVYCDGHFVEYSSLGWHLWSLRVCRTSFQSLLIFKVSIEKSDILFFFFEKSNIILIGLPLYDTESFSLVAFNILFVGGVLYTFSALITVC